MDWQLKGVYLMTAAAAEQQLESNKDDSLLTERERDQHKLEQTKMSSFLSFCETPIRLPSYVRPQLAICPDKKKREDDK